MSDCLIIGGGAIGMMSARTLALAGMNVTLIDQRECARESSWAGGGIISPLYPWQYDDLTNQLSFESQAVYQDLCTQLREDTGIDPQYRKTGLLMMDEYDSPQAQAWMAKRDITYQLCDKGALFAHVAQVRNPRLLQALQADIKAKGVRIIENLKVNNVLTKDENVLGVNTENGNYYAEHVVVCAGAWSSQVLNLTQAIFPIKGQMIVLKAPINTLEHIILDQGKYIIPRADGRILIGSSMEDVGFDKSIDEQTKYSLRDFALGHLPSLATAEIEHHWSGFRPANKSGTPMIERHQDYKNLFINTGHFRNGLNMAPASADKIKGLINDIN